MAKWINVDENQRQISHVEDPTFWFGIYMDEYKKMDGHMLPLHWHKSLEYELVISGKVEMRIDNETVTLEVGDCAFINSNTLHSGIQLSTTEDAVVCAVSFIPDVLTGSVENTVYQKYFQPIFGKTVYGFKIDCQTPTGKNIYNTLCRLSKLKKDSFGYELMAISQTCELWLDTLKYIQENNPDSGNKKETYSHKKDAMKVMLEYVQENYDKNISIDSLLEHTHISRSECFRSFKQYTGKTPLEYINDYRLLQAEHLLRTTTLSLIDICLSCGFAGQSYFGKLFKQRYGVSPSRYRKAHN